MTPEETNDQQPALQGVADHAVPLSGFATAVRHAFDRTDKQHNALVERKVGRLGEQQFKRLMQSDVDFQPDAQTNEEFRLNFQQFRAHFAATVDSATDPQTLYQLCESFIEDDLHRLFYRTNDNVNAHVHHDYVGTFLDEVLPVLKASHLIDEVMGSKFDTLREAYDLGLESYHYLRADLLEKTGNDQGLINEASRMVEGMPKDGLPDTMEPEEIRESAAYNVLHEMIEEYYYTRLGDYQIPHPLMLLLLRYSEVLAEATLHKQRPNDDMFDPKTESLDGFLRIYQPIVKQWLETLADGPVTLEKYVTIANDLQARTNAIEGIPEDFTALVAKASKHAATTVSGRVQHYLNEAAKDERIPPAHSHSVIMRLIPSYGSAPSVARDLSYYLDQTKDIGRARDTNMLILSMERTTEALEQEVAFRGTHPALLLAAKDYMAELRRNLGGALHERGVHDTTLLTHMKEVEEKVGHQYASNGVLSDWVMENTADGFDNLFHMVCMQRGYDPLLLTKTGVRQMADHAQTGLGQLADKYGVPEALRMNMLMPLIHDRCRAVAEAELEKEAAEEKKAVPKFDQQSWEARVGGSYRMVDRTRGAQDDGPPPDQVAAKVKNALLETRTREVMGWVLEAVTPNVTVPEGEQSPAKPNLSGHGLRIVLGMLEMREHEAELATEGTRTLH